jgi:putative NADPH-quinone reductase
MLFQVIHCHPLADSYNHALFRTIVETLEVSGHEVVATDLYREEFDPVLTTAERAGYFSVPYEPTTVARYAELLRRAEGLIFCFPQWWFSMPAMLIGYFERVWAPSIAFEHDPAAAGGLRPLLTHVQVFGVVTSYGAPWWIARLAGDPARKVLLRALKPMCGRRTRSFYLAHYAMDHSTPASRAAFLERVRRRIEKL